MIEADGWETVYCSAPVLERLMRIAYQRGMRFGKDPHRPGVYHIEFIKPLAVVT